MSRTGFVAAVIYLSLLLGTFAGVVVLTLVVSPVPLLVVSGIFWAVFSFRWAWAAGVNTE